MNIAMTASTLPGPGASGASYQAHYLANALVQAGHSVTMFSMSDRPADALYSHTQLPRSHRATYWRFAWHLRKLDFSRFDVLHCHGDDCFLAWKRKPRHLRTLHGSSFAEAANCHIPRLKARMYALGLGELASLKVADLCVANSKDTMARFPSVRHFIPCGVDLSVFRPGAERSPNPSILFVGGLQGKKRGWLLQKAFLEEIRPSLPTAELWVVSGERAVGEGVRSLGKVPTQTLVELYQAAWVFCMPSSYEGFGVPYVEAMAAGTPVVATNNPGAAEVLAGGRYGALCRDEALGSTLLSLLHDASERSRLSEVGLLRAQCYGWPSVVEQYLCAYRGVPWELLE